MMAMKMLAEAEEKMRKRKAAATKATPSPAARTAPPAISTPRQPACAAATADTDVHAHQVLHVMLEG
jgi:hypothetical protein